MSEILLHSWSQWGSRAYGNLEYVDAGYHIVG
jgi:hypothetical protein